MKKFFRMVVFLSLLVTLIVLCNRVLRFKYVDGIYPLETFYKLENNTIDVLVLGSSHAFEDINPAVMWEEAGIAAYNLCGSVQPLWNTYHYMLEALKTQKPKLIILEGYRVCETRDYADESRIIKNNFGLKWSLNKLRSIKVSVPPEKYGDYLLEYASYHTRYTELSKSDFEANLGIKNLEHYKGFGANYGLKEFDKPDVSHELRTTMLSPKTEEYYRKIIECAKQNNIPLLIVISPYILDNSEQRYYNTAEKIAKEEGIPFINYNLLYEEIGLDFTADFADENHLNVMGSEKYTKSLMEYLKENYEFTDHRGEKSYNSWNINAVDYRKRLYNSKLKEADSIEDYIVSLLNNETYTIVISIEGKLGNKYLNMLNIMRELGIAKEGYNLQGTWIMESDKSIQEVKDELFHTQIGDDVLTIQKDVDAVKQIVIGDTNYKKVDNGINFIVYDTYIDEVVDAVGFNAKREFYLVR